MNGSIEQMGRKKTSLPFPKNILGSDIMVVINSHYILFRAKIQ